MKEYVSLTTAVMKMGKKRFYCDHGNRVCYTYIMDFLEPFTSCRYHSDMKILKKLTSDSKRFRVYGIFKK